MNSNNNKSPRIIYFTRYRLEGNIGGGGRRAKQIIGQCRDADLSYYSAVTAPEPGAVGKETLKKIIAFLHFPFDYFKWRKEWRKRLFWFSRLSRTWRKQAASLNPGDWVFIEDPYYFKHLVTHLKKKQITIIALPQNIETLFEHYCKEKYRLDLLKKEVKWLKKCALAVTNSREEAFFLTNNNVEVLFHPYYPPAPIRERLLRVRENRRAAPKEYFLLMGGAGNEATRNGMAALMDTWKKHITGEKLWVAGYNTEGLKAHADNDTVIFKGPVPDNQLDDVLINAKAVVCFQEKGAGALTRIAEMLIANIPVIGNSHAVRSYYNVPGVHEFEGTEDFKQQVERFRSAPAEARLDGPGGYPEPGNLLEKLKRRIHA